jgi:hypothetical protein
VQFQTPWLKFVDDTEFWYDPAAKVVQVRSASRVGRKDFGVNRARVESIRSRLERGLTRSPPGAWRRPSSTASTWRVAPSSPPSRQASASGRHSAGRKRAPHDAGVGLGSARFVRQQAPPPSRRPPGS